MCYAQIHEDNIEVKLMISSCSKFNNFENAKNKPLKRKKYKA